MGFNSRYVKSGGMTSGKSKFKLLKVGLARRKKEAAHMKIMTGLTILFLSLTLLFQDNINSFQMKMNYDSYGKWFLRTSENGLEQDNLCLEDVGEIQSGSDIYLKLSEDTADSITVPASGDERDTGIILGAVDEESADSVGINLYEGRLPENDNEIAVELSLLRQLNLSYDLNQEITFYVSENDNAIELMNDGQDMKLYTVSYKVVGIIKNYTTFWNEASVLPGAVVTPEAFDRLAMNKIVYSFYGISREYENDDVWILAQGLWNDICEGLEEKGTSYDVEGYVFNRFAYDNPFWGNKVMYRNMTIILSVLGSLVMAYLMSSYLAKRRSFYFRLREMGATVVQVWKMAAYECVISTLLVAVVSLVLSYALSVVAVYFVAAALGMEFFYVFRIRTLAHIIICFAAVVLVAMFAALFSFRTGHITENRNSISKPAMRLLKRRALKRKKRLGVNDIFKRFRVSYPLPAIFSRIVGILTCGTIIICLMQINGKVSVYNNVRQVYHDFMADNGRIYRQYPRDSVSVVPYLDYYGEEVTSVDIDMTDEIYSMENIFTEDFLADINELSGIKKTEYVTRDETHVFEWQGKGTGWYYQYNMDNFLEMTLNGDAVVPDYSTEEGQEFADYVDSTFYSGRYYTDCQSVWDELSVYGDKKIEDYNEFCAGGQVFIIENDSGLFDDSAKIDRDNTLNAGDVLTIKTKGRDVNVVVAGILSMSDVISYSYGSSTYNLVGSDELCRRIAENDGITFGYNYMVVEYNAMADSEATGKIISKLCVNNGLSYESGSEYISAAYKNMVKGILVYGTLAAIIFIIYIFVLSCILNDEGRRMYDRLERFHKIGIPQNEIFRVKIKEGFKDSLYMLFAVPVSYVIMAFKVSTEWSSSCFSGYSSLLRREVYYRTKEQYVFYGLLDVINLWWLALAMVFVLAAVMFVRYRNSVKMWER